MAPAETPPGVDEALSLDEVAPRRRPAGSGRRLQVLAAGAVIILVAAVATVAAVAGPAPDSTVGEGVALVADAGTTTTVAPTTTAPVPTTIAPTPATTIAPEVGATDCGDAAMCGDIATEGPCEDAGMCGEIRANDDCTDGDMCGDIPVPSECSDPAMCGDIVPEPVG